MEIFRRLILFMGYFYLKNFYLNSQYLSRSVQGVRSDSVYFIRNGWIPQEENFEEAQ